MCQSLIESDPGLAKDLLDLMMWTNQPNLGDNDDYDDLSNSYIKMCRRVPKRIREKSRAA
jgi:hypothetical protein